MKKDPHYEKCEDLARYFLKSPAWSEKEIQSLAAAIQELADYWEPPHDVGEYRTWGNMIIKSNEELFDKWRELSIHVASLAGIVQNDMEISQEDITTWRGRCVSLEEEIEELRLQTLRYIKELNP